MSTRDGNDAQPSRRDILRWLVATTAAGEIETDRLGDRLAWAADAAVEARQGAGDIAAAAAILAAARAALQRTRGRALSAAADRGLAVLHQSMQVALDRNRGDDLGPLLAEADDLVELLPAAGRRVWVGQLTHTRGRRCHNRDRPTEALRYYLAAGTALCSPTLDRDTGSALRAVGDWEAARRFLRAAADGWATAGSPPQAARCLSLLARVAIDEARQTGTRRAVERAVGDLLALERDDLRLTPTRNPLAFVQHRMNLIAGLAAIDPRAAAEVAAESARIIRAAEYAREWDALRKVCQEIPSTTARVQFGPAGKGW